MKQCIATSALVLALVVNTLLGNVCTKKLVIDTDGGADDAGAIFLVLSAWRKNNSDYETIAITCVNGNTIEKNVEQNVLKMITTANAPHIKVYGGAEKPLVGNSTTDYYFGNDGLGDFAFNETITAKVDKSTYAAVALIKLAKKYQGELTVLCLGPLTNIAIAAALDPTFMNNVKRFYIMGGSVAGVGNKIPGAEFNFAIDPESNFIVLNHTKTEPYLIYPWETVLNTKIPKTWRINTLGTIKSKIVNFMNKAEAKSLQVPSLFWTPADLQATAVMLWPYLSKKSLITNVTPVTDGAARGIILVDYSNKSGKPKNAEIVQELDVIAFQQNVIKNFS